MTYVQTEIATPSEVVEGVLTHLRNGEINEATACFAERTALAAYFVEWVEL
jgi:hypothetical protein